jgi:hypothetical protein
MSSSNIRSNIIDAIRKVSPRSVELESKKATTPLLCQIALRPIPHITTCSPKVAQRKIHPAPSCSYNFETLSMMAPTWLARGLADGCFTAAPFAFSLYAARVLSLLKFWLI